MAEPDPRQVKLLLTALDSEDYALREKATQELAKLGKTIYPALRQALAGPVSVEVRRRLEGLLAVNPAPPLRALRALQVLERVATGEARDLLQRLAAGAPETHLTEEAKAALQRLKKRLGRP
jgi:HEAT repeat protein